MSARSDFWDREAATFDEQPDHGLGDPTVRDAWAALVADMLPRCPCRIVDVGCGTGSLSVLMAAQGHAVTGVDFSSKMVELARRKARAASVDVDFRVGDAADPPLDRHSVDVVLGRHVLWALPRPSDAIGRWLDLLDRDGRLVLIEGRWSTGAGLPARETIELIRAHRREARAVRLSDPAYWGGPIDDERYVVTSPP